jgi:hypothetical protein
MFSVNLELVSQNLTALKVNCRIAGINWAKFAHVQRGTGTYSVPATLLELAFNRGSVNIDTIGRSWVRPTSAQACSDVVVARVDSVLPGLLEDVELGRIAVAVDEQDMVGVDAADCGYQAFIEGPDDCTRFICRFVHEVVASHPDFVLITVCDSLPKIDDTILELSLLPEHRAMRRVV